MGKIFEGFDVDDLKDLKKGNELVLFLGENETVHGHFKDYDGHYLNLENVLDIPICLEIPFLNSDQMEVINFLRKLDKPVFPREKELGYNMKINWDVYRINSE